MLSMTIYYVQAVDCLLASAKCPSLIVLPSIEMTIESAEFQKVFSCSISNANLLTNGGFSNNLRQLLSSVGELPSSELVVDGDFT
jgi:hypothetical protein